MTREERAATKVKALERILAKPLTSTERVAYENRLAEVDAQLARARSRKAVPKTKTCTCGAQHPEAEKCPWCSDQSLPF